MKKHKHLTDELSQKEKKIEILNTCKNFGSWLTRVTNLYFFLVTMDTDN